MSQLPLPWLELALLLALLGACVLSVVSDPDRARKWFLAFSGTVLLCVLVGWRGFVLVTGATEDVSWSFLAGLLGPGFLLIDELNGPLLALTALLYVLT